ncbi:protein phosphatase inhibitor 2 isoform X1 [Brassica napus]|uniref:protein phosphatase inhibitor 2 isoform X1 n=1 Tax=Brassica napus TaxID=3708 RepID=UPI0006AABC18|nr:protein phosphatase inhibitor 2 isoform X1 [Brassica napus]
MTKGRVQWDEANIVEIESNKPVRQKITEPKTPYHPPYPMIDDDGGSLSSRVRSFDNFVEMHRAEELKNDLNDLASSSKIISHISDSGDWTPSEDEAEPIDQNEEDPEGEKNTSFNEHRRVHYDEFRMVKEMRSSGGSFYGEDAEGDDSAKTGKPEATISQNTPGAADAISSGKSSSSST